MGNHYVLICHTTEIPKGKGKSFQIGKLNLAIFHTEEGFLATNDICSHEHEHLSDGWLEGNLVECPRHGSQFDLRTGEALSLPATEPIEVYELKIEGDDVIVSIPEKYLASVGIGKG